MASPIGHTLAGLSLYLGVRRRDDGPAFPPLETAVVILAANAPDLDFLPGILRGDPNMMHHDFTHSIFYALLVSFCILAVGMLIKGAGKVGRRLALLVGGLVLLHIALDMITIDVKPPIGMKLVWPLSQKYYIAPWMFLDSVARGHVTLPLLKTWAGIAVKETVIFGLPFGLLVWRRKRGERKRDAGVA